MISVDVQEDQEATMLRFLNGLRPEITEVVQLQYYIEIGDMVHKAVNVEWCLKRRGTIGSNFNFQPTDWRTAQPKKDERNSAHNNSIKPIFEAAKSNSKAVQESSQSQNRDNKCFKCQSYGHIASQSPNQQSVLILDNGEDITEDEAEYEECHL